MAHYERISGHPGQTVIVEGLRELYYWPLMASDDAIIIRNCEKFAWNLVRVKIKTNTMTQFKVTRPLECTSLNLFGPVVNTST